VRLEVIFLQKAILVNHAILKKKNCETRLTATLLHLFGGWYEQVQGNFQNKDAKQQLFKNVGFSLD
jgi:hypothetical protein